VGNIELKGPLGDLGVNGRIIFEGMSKNYYGWTLKGLVSPYWNKWPSIVYKIMNRRVSKIAENVFNS